MIRLLRTVLHSCPALRGSTSCLAASHTRRNTQAGHSRQQGMAVVAALVVVAAAAIATAAIMERQALLADTLVGERDRAQANWLLRGGLDWSRVILLNDARRNAVTRHDAVWAQPIVGLEVSTPNDTRKAYFSGQIEDEQSKYNLENLAVQAVVQPAEVQFLETLLTGLGLPALLGGAIAQRVAQGQTNAFGEQAAPGLRSLGDLLSLEAMSPDLVRTLAPYLTILPQKTALNANTARAEVLSACVPGLDLARARDLVDQRDRGQWFTSRADFFNRLGDSAIRPTDQVDVSSEWFKVTGEVTLDQSAVQMQALLHRQRGAPPVIRWIKD